MAISVTKPTVGGSEDAWGATINTALDTIVDGINGTSGTIAPDLSTLTIDGVDVTATAQQLNKLDGVTVSTQEINYLSTATSSIQTQLNAKAASDGATLTNATLTSPDISSPTMTGTATVATLDLGDWTIAQSGTSLKFSYSGTDRFELKSTGELTVEGDVTAFGDA